MYLRGGEGPFSVPMDSFWIDGVSWWGPMILQSCPNEWVVHAQKNPVDAIPGTLVIACDVDVDVWSKEG